MRVLKLLLLFVVMSVPSAHAIAAHVNWSHDVEAALQEANRTRRLVFMKFTADWCGYCKKMERETFTRPAVAEFVNREFVPVLVDADKHADLVKHLKIRGFPAMLIVSPEMVILERISGYQTEQKLMPTLRTAVATHQIKPAQGTETRTVSAQNSGQPSPQTISQPDIRPATATQNSIPSDTGGAPAFGGLCLPGVRNTRSLISGTPQWTTVYRGKKLYFSSDEQRQSFLASPAKYWPADDGNCPVLQLEQGRRVEGRLEFAAMFRGRLWVMHSAAAMRNFVAEPATYVEAATKSQRTVRTDSNGFTQ